MVVELGLYLALPTFHFQVHIQNLFCCCWIKQESVHLKDQHVARESYAPAMSSKL
jgi:hypothetical protein